MTAVLDTPAPVTSDAPEAPVVTPKAPAEPKPAKADKYPAKEVGQAIAARVAAVREAGFNRPLLQKLVAEVNISGEGEGGDGFFMAGSALWRTEKGNVHADEVEYITAVLDKIESGEIKLDKPVKGSSVVDWRLGAAAEILTGVDPKATKPALQEALNAALAVLQGPAERPEENEEAANKAEGGESTQTGDDANQSTETA